MYAFCPLFLERLKDEGRRLKENVNFINLFGIILTFYSFINFLFLGFSANGFLGFSCFGSVAVTLIKSGISS